MLISDRYWPLRITEAELRHLLGKCLCKLTDPAGARAAWGAQTAMLRKMSGATTTPEILWVFTHTHTHTSQLAGDSEQWLVGKIVALRGFDFESILEDLKFNFVFSRKRKIFVFVTR